MNCSEKKCPHGFRNCCIDCEVQKLGACRDACTGVKMKKTGGECGHRRRLRREEKQRKRKTMVWLLAILAAVSLMLVFSLQQVYATNQYIKNIKKSCPAATEQPSVQRDTNKITYSIAETEVLSNDQ